MPEQKKYITEEELKELKEETEKSFQRAAELIREVAANREQSDKISDETRREIEEIRRKREAESTRCQAEIEEIRRKREAESIRRQAEIEEIRRKREAESIRCQAEIEEIRRKREAESKRCQAEIEEIRKKSEAESAIRRAEIEEIQRRANELSEKNEKTIAELSAASKNHGKSIGDLGNKFGKFTESLAEPSLKRILDERFEADYQGWLLGGKSRGAKDLEVDGWATARNGTGAAFLVEIKSRFKPKHIKQVWRIVEKFRQYKTEYRHQPVYPILAVVEITDRHREQVWNSGIYLIEIADGVFEMAKPPANFNAFGFHGMEGVRRDVPHLRLVRSDNWQKRISR